MQALAEKMRQAGTFLPTLSIDPSFSVTHERGLRDRQLTVPLNASATGSLANASSLGAAGSTVEQRAQLLLDDREAILLQVAQSYYTVLQDEHQADVYESSIRFKAEKVRDQEARLKLGGVRPLDVAQSQADLAATRVSLTESRTQADNARSALARLMGVAAVDGPLTDHFEPPPDICPIDEWHHRATEQRQDLLAAERAVESARQSLEAAVRRYFPSVTINFSYFLYNDPTTLQAWNGAISANIPIFSALSIESDIRRAWSVYRQAGIAQSQAGRIVADDVNQAFHNLLGSRRKIADLRVEVAAAQRAFDLAERANQLGSVSNLDRLTQQDSLLTAQLTLVREQYNEKSSYLSLLRAEGRLASVLDRQPMPADAATTQPAVTSPNARTPATAESP